MLIFKTKEQHRRVVLTFKKKEDAEQPKPRSYSPPKRAVMPPNLPSARFNRKILNKTHHDPTKQLNVSELVTRVVALAQVLAEKKFYPYQVELASRIVESMLEHDGEVITALMSRQAGKSETLSAITAAIILILPGLAKRFPQDWRLNITDETGVYRGYGYGIKIGMYAPKIDQSEMIFDKVKKCLSSDTGKRVLKELGIAFEVRNGNKIRLTNGSRILCETASDQSKIEGETHHLLVCEEAQDISDHKMRRSLHPMTAATMGSIVKIGTATTKKCDFYTAIKINERVQTHLGKRNHFFYPWSVVVQFNSLYRDYIEKEKLRIGETSDEFQTSYGCVWIFERGMFVTQEALFNRQVALDQGQFSIRYTHSLPLSLRKYSIVVGIDWGASHDSTVLTVVAVDWTNPFDSGIVWEEGEARPYVFYRKHVINWVEFLGDNYEVQFHTIVQYLTQLTGLRKVIMDSNTCGKPLYDRFSALFRNKGVMIEPFNFQAQVKSEGYKVLHQDISGKRVTFPASPLTRKSAEYQRFVNQMLDLRKDYKGGLMCIAHPNEKGAHDDFGDSFMMANWGANNPANSNSIDFSSENPFLR